MRCGTRSTAHVCVTACHLVATPTRPAYAPPATQTQQPDRMAAARRGRFMYCSSWPSAKRSGSEPSPSHRSSPSSLPVSIRRASARRRRAGGRVSRWVTLSPSRKFQPASVKITSGAPTLRATRKRTWGEQPSRSRKASVSGTCPLGSDLETYLRRRHDGSHDRCVKHSCGQHAAPFVHQPLITSRRVVTRKHALVNGGTCGARSAYLEM